MTDTTATDIGPLDWRIAITDGNGKPTAEFQRRWNTQRNNNSLISTITVADTAPTTPVPADGNGYVNTATTPPTFYVSSDGQWVEIGVYQFIQLSDAPNSYTGANGNLVQVNSGATGLQFSSFSSVLDTLGNTQGDIIYRGSAGWTTLNPGISGYVLTTKGTGANPVWAASSGSSVGGVLPLVTGDLPGPNLIADPYGQTIGVPL